MLCVFDDVSGEFLSLLLDKLVVFTVVFKTIIPLTLMAMTAHSTSRDNC